MSETVHLLDLITKGVRPVRVLAPATVEGGDLKRLLVTAGILHQRPDSCEVEEPIGNFLRVQAAPVVVTAFYYQDHGPFLMQFSIDAKARSPAGTEVGIVESLTGDEELARLFSVTEASARVLCCSKSAFDELRRYAAGLSAGSDFTAGAGPSRGEA